MQGCRLQKGAVSINSKPSCASGLGGPCRNRESTALLLLELSISASRLKFCFNRDSTTKAKPGIANSREQQPDIPKS